MDTAPARPGSSEPPSASRRRLADRLLLHAPVLATDQIAARMTRIRLDLAVLDHGDGPGVDWARHARPGQLVAFTRPQGTLTARPSGSHLLIGEETAAVAFGAILRALRVDQNALTIIEADEPGDQLPLPGDVHWHYRHGRSAASSASLVRAVRNTSLPGPGTAYLAGEARTIQALRSHLTGDRGWPRHAIITKPFWTPGKKGME
jgi:NADPH-dependent ferric siderophore reductase